MRGAGLIMKKSLQATQQEFESSTGKTPQYLAWHRLFKRELTAFLKQRGAVEIQISRPNHFDLTGFFRLNGQIWYVSLSDVRYSKGTLLVRTAQSFKDYYGGQNLFVSLTDGADVFCQEFDKALQSTRLFLVE